MTCSSQTQQCIYFFRLTSSHRGWHSLSSGFCSPDSLDSHPLTEDDLRYYIYTVARQFFRLTSSHRGWPATTGTSSANQSSFRLTSSHRGWLRTTQIYVFTANFRLTSSHRGWHYLFFLPFKSKVSLDSHPLTEDDPPVLPVYALW